MEQEYTMMLTQSDLEIIMAGLQDLPFRQVAHVVNKINDSYNRQCAQNVTEISEETTEE